MAGSGGGTAAPGGGGGVGAGGGGERQGRAGGGGQAAGARQRARSFPQVVSSQRASEGAAQVMSASERESAWTGRLSLASHERERERESALAARAGKAASCPGHTAA
eukprot:2163701-Rhodomonas_salina.4